MEPPLRALWTAVVYFGSFLILGFVAKIALDRWAQRHDIDLAGIQTRAGLHRGKRRLFLLGAWRDED
jgi:hypothetical protein